MMHSAEFSWTRSRPPAAGLWVCAVWMWDVVIAVFFEAGLVLTVGAALIVERTQCLCLFTWLIPLLLFLCFWICSFSALFCSPLCPLWLASAWNLSYRAWTLELLALLFKFDLQPLELVFHLTQLFALFFL